MITAYCVYRAIIIIIYLHKPEVPVLLCKGHIIFKWNSPRKGSLFLIPFVYSWIFYESNIRLSYYILNYCKLPVLKLASCNFASGSQQDRRFHEINIFNLISLRFFLVRNLYDICRGTEFVSMVFLMDANFFN
jgi:hypothetical protein